MTTTTATRIGPAARAIAVALVNQYDAAAEWPVDNAAAVVLATQIVAHPVMADDVRSIAGDVLAEEIDGSATSDPWIVAGLISPDTDDRLLSAALLFERASDEIARRTERYGAELTRAARNPGP